MYESELVLSGLKKQHHLLNDLINHLESRSHFDYADYGFCDERTKKVASNLRKLRKIKRDYVDSN